MLIRYMTQSLIIGVAVGFLVAIYRFTLEVLDKFAFDYFAGLQDKSIMLLLLAVIALLLMGIIIGRLMEKFPEIIGAGLEYVHQALNNVTNSRILGQILVAKFVSGILAIAGGVFIGRVGPSLQMGTCVAQILNKWFYTSSDKEQQNMLAAANCAALTTVLSAPVSSIIYVFEGLLQKRSWRTLSLCIPAIVSAYAITIYFFGDKAVLLLHSFNRLHAYEYLIFVALGCVLGLSAFIFEKLLFVLKYLYDRYISLRYRPLVPLTFTMVFALHFPLVLGDGNKTLALLDFSRGLDFLIVIFLLKTFFFMIAFASGIPGGMFLPTLIIGSLMGAVVAESAILYLGMPEVLFANVLIVSMAGFFGSVMSVPLTAVVLVSELTLSLNNVVPMLIVCYIAHSTTKILRIAYEKLQTNSCL